MAGQQTELRAVTLTDKTVARPIHEWLVALHPLLDLVAIATNRDGVEVFRASGSRAFGVRGSAPVTSVCWSHDGAELSIVWAHAVTQNVPASSTGLVAGKSVKVTEAADQPCPAVFQHWQHTRRSAKDLAERLLRLDPWTQLPKFGALPSGYEREPVGDDDPSLCIDKTYPGQAIDDVPGVNISIVGSPEGNVLYTINDLSIPAFSAAHGIRLMHTDSSGTTAVASVTDGTLRAEMLVPQYLESNGRRLVMIIRSLSVIPALTRYIERCTEVLSTAWAFGRQGLDRRLESISSSDLQIESTSSFKASKWSMGLKIVQGNASIDIVASLQQLAITGKCPAAVKEWITEEMGTQGILRWYNALGAQMRRVLDVCHQNLIPAIDRLAVEVVSLRVLARGDEPLCQVINMKLLGEMIDDLDILRILAHSTLDYVADEAHEAFIFAEWLLSQHARLHDPTAQSAREAERKISETDYPQLMRYIEGGLTKSRANIFLGHEADRIANAPRRPKMSPRRDIVEAMLTRHATTSIQPGQTVEYTNLRYISHFLSDTARAIKAPVPGYFFGATTRSSLDPLPLSGEQQATSLFISESDPAAMISIVDNYNDNVQVYRLTSSSKHVVAELKLDSDETVVDAKLIAASHKVCHLFLLIDDPEKTRLALMTFPTQQQAPVLQNSARLEAYIFAQGHGSEFWPAFLSVQQSREQPDHFRVLLFDEPRTRYRITSVMSSLETRVDKRQAEESDSADEALVIAWLQGKNIIADSDADELKASLWDFDRLAQEAQLDEDEEL